MRAFVTGGSGFVGRELVAALARRGDEVRALARSARSEGAVRAAGAEPVAGDLDSVEALTEGMRGCDAVFHCAAHTEEWDSDEAFHRINVAGTENALAAARAAGVRRFLLVSTEAVLVQGRPLVDVDESVPIPPRPLPGYPRTKALAEQRVRAANGVGGLETVVIRPRFVWGRGDTSNLPKFVEACRSGRFAWVSGGRHLTSSCHVANVVEGAILAVERGRAGEVYFLTDGAPVEFRWLLTEVLKTQGVSAPSRSVPFPLAWAAATAGELLWRTFGRKGAPPVTRVAVGLMGRQVTVRDVKARRELGYQGRVSISEGLAELARLPPVVP